MDIVRKLQKNGFKAYFVGGSVRDQLLNIPATEIDITTSAKPEDINRIFKRTYNIGAVFGIVNVVEKGINFEVATFRKEGKYTDGRHPGEVEYTENVEEDAKRRDFTVNAFFYDPVKGCLLDFFNGRNDLKTGVLRSIGNVEDRFKEDYLRILRAIRIGSKLNFYIADDVINAIQKYAGKLQELSTERVRDELNKMFTGPHRENALQVLYDTGVLKIILPEIDSLKDVTQSEKFHPEGDVFEHTKLMLKRMVFPSIELAWAVLLHDVGKPATKHIDRDGRERFFYHDSEGSHIAFEVLKRLKFSKQIRETVSVAVKNHMRFANVCKMKVSKWKRIMCASTFPLELELHRLDCVCSNSITENFVFLIDKLIELEGETALPEPFLSGDDLKKLGLKPGPLFSKILNDIQEKQINGKIPSVEDAKKYVVRFYMKD